jgi:RNA polymerase sigma-70 factor (ECF subfamily)
LSQGEDAAFWTLWSRHEKSLRQVCVREMGGHRADAEDALSQVMLKAMDRLARRTEAIECLEAWLHRLARNLCIDLRRGADRRLETAVGADEDLPAAPPPDLNRDASEAMAELHRRIAALPPLLREPFVLRVMQAVPSRGVALKLGLSSATVRKRVHLARARLRDGEDAPALEAAGGGDGTGRLANEIPGGEGSAEPFPSILTVSTVCVRLPCGVDQWFHVFSERAGGARGRRLHALDGYLRDHPRSWKKRLERAELLYLAGDWNEAIGEWQCVRAQRPYFPGILKLGDALLRLGATKAAAEVFRGAHAQRLPWPATERHLQGWLAFCDQDALGAAREFQAAIDLEPKNPIHWHSLAVAHRLGGMIPAALAALASALELDPHDPVALSYGHDLLMAAGNVAEAAQRAQRLLQRAPLDLLTRRRLLECRCRLDLTRGEAGQETEQMLRRILRDAPHAAAVRDPLAAFLIAQGEPQKAVAVYRDFVEAFSQCPRGRRGYARLLAETGLPDTASAARRIANWSTARICAGACGWCDPVVR